MPKDFTSLLLFLTLAGMLIPLLYLRRVKPKKLQYFAFGYYFLSPIVMCLCFYSGLKIETCACLSGVSMIAAFYFGFTEKKKNNISHAEFKRYIRCIALSYFVAPLLIALVFFSIAVIGLVNNSEGPMMMGGISLMLMGVTWVPSIMFLVSFAIFSTLKIYRSTELVSETPVTSE